MYTYSKQVLFSDINKKQEISLDGMMNVIQDCININSEAIGKGIDYMHNSGRAWFAVGWNIEVKRFPKMLENITVKTWPYDFTPSIGFRNVVISDEEGNDIVCADSFWSIVNRETGRPARIEEVDSAGYELEERYDMPKLGRKIKLPAEFTKVDELKVRRAYIDFNGHMSNSIYISIASEYILEDKAIRRIRVEYKSQSLCDEMLSILVSYEQNSEENRYVVKIVGKEDESVKAIVEFLV